MIQLTLDDIKTIINYQYECMICHKPVTRAKMCAHSLAIAINNIGKYALDDMVMCKVCCADEATWQDKLIIH